MKRGCSGWVGEGAFRYAPKADATSLSKSSRVCIAHRRRSDNLPHCHSDRPPIMSGGTTKVIRT